ncbi:MAG: hypothetical protein ACOYMZ_03370 [Minisyncoccia bacterium]
MKKLIAFSVIFFLVINVFAQKASKKLTFKNKNITIEAVHFNRNVSEAEINAFAKKNNYVLGDTADVKFLSEKQNSVKLPLHSNVYVLLGKKPIVHPEHYKRPETLIVCWILSVNASWVSLAKDALHVDRNVFHNFNYEEEGDEENYICFRRKG